MRGLSPSNAAGPFSFFFRRGDFPTSVPFGVLDPSPSGREASPLPGKPSTYPPLQSDLPQFSSPDGACLLHFEDSPSFLSLFVQLGRVCGRLFFCKKRFLLSSHFPALSRPIQDIFFAKTRIWPFFFFPSWRHPPFPPRPFLGCSSFDFSLVRFKISPEMQGSVSTDPWAIPPLLLLISCMVIPAQAFTLFSLVITTSSFDPPLFFLNDASSSARLPMKFFLVVMDFPR